MHLNICCIALSCLVKLPLVAINGVSMVLNHAIFFFLIEHEEKPPLRGAICDIWEPTNSKIVPKIYRFMAFKK